MMSHRCVQPGIAPRSVPALIRALLVVTCSAGAAAARADERAAPGDDVVLERLYPKARTLELGLGGGLLLNPTFVETSLARLSVRYHWSETWGIGLDAAVARTRDRKERRCVETFYNDPLREAGAPCAAEDDADAPSASDGVNLGPAYVPIRELRGMVALYGDYTLGYGKQILLLGGTSHFDLRLRFGGGAVVSDFYAERETVRGQPDRPSRGDPQGEGGAPKAGVDAGERDGDGLLYGEEGRPEPRRETTPALYLGLAEELHFARRFFLSAELAAYAMTSAERGFEPFLVAELGLGVRL
jgi:hypothetical protein